jgi:glycosyltransferase involved in cell wall biosynthesis
VTHNPPNSASGIGRFVQEILKYVSPHIPMRTVRTIPPPLSRRVTTLYHFPAGIDGHQPGAALHYTQIMGCAVQLWRRFRPAVATIHDLGVVVCKEDEPLLDRIGRSVLDVQLVGVRRMDQYAVNSLQTRDHLVRHLGVDERRIHFVQLGVDLENFRPIPTAYEELARRYNFHKQPGVFDLIYVGSELPRKNVGLILSAMAALKKKGYCLRLIKIGGAGGERWRTQTMAQIKELGLEADVYFPPGIVPEPDLPLFYGGADLAVTATLLEGGFAWVAMEAMACGRPVVASTGALIPEAATAGALVVSERSVDEMVRAIARCIDDEALRARLSTAGQHLIASYTWQATAQAMLKVYEKL